MKRSDEIKAEAAVVVARLIAGEICDASDNSLKPDILRRAAKQYEDWLRSGVIPNT